MSANRHVAEQHLRKLFSERSMDELIHQLAPKTDNPAAPIPTGHSADALQQRWQLLPASEADRAALCDAETAEQIEQYHRNAENVIGTVKVPVGIAGPLRVNGLFAQGDYYVPLATTEAALVASYNRGSQLISEVGGCSAALLNEGISRAPGFAFRNLQESGQFVLWATSQFEQFSKAAASTTRYGKLSDVRITIEGNHVYLNFELTTGDAAGQNMVTLATEAICDYVREHSPIQPQYWFVEANLSGDKKASAQSFLLVRGKKVSAEVVLPADVVQRRLHVTPAQMADYWRMSALGGVLSGTLGVHGHYANGLAAFYLACGQDVACVAESAVGVTRFEVTGDGSLYASVTLPNVIVGSVGGGTALPSQQACLNLMGLAGPGKAQALAEVCVGMCLAGELSIIGALCSGDFSRAHRLFARRRSGTRAKTSEA